MIKSWSLVYKTVNLGAQIEHIFRREACMKKRIFESSAIHTNFVCYNTKFSIATTQVNMNIFKFSNYDCIGFDLDNTLLRYKVTNMVQLEYEILAKYLVTKKGYDPRYLLKPLDDKGLDFMQKGLCLDVEKGNILRISPNGTIQRACHGSKLLSVNEISKIYPDKRWDVTDAFCNDILSTWNGPLSMKMRSLLDYFDISSSLIFARAVDTLDEKNGGPLNVYHIWPDMLDGLIEMFNREHFKTEKGHYFSSLKNHPEKYLHKCSAKTISWLKAMKKNCITFLITGSNADFANFTASYALGEDWMSFFDIVICYAKKPGFFTSERPFLCVTDFEEGDEVQSKDLIKGGIYSQGNWKGLMEFLTRLSKKSNPNCLYIGDNLLQDIYVPSAYVNCDTVAVIEEQMSEGMVHQGLSHPDDKILNSTFWGSYFCLKDSQTNIDSIWSYIITKYAKLCIPEIDLVAQHPLEQPYLCFSKTEKKYRGYYPAVPLSISSL